METNSTNRQASIEGEHTEQCVLSFIIIVHHSSQNLLTALKPHIMQTIKLPFGFKSFSIGNIIVYTGKIRIKSNCSDLMIALQNYSEHLQFTETSRNFNRYTTITFSTTSVILNQQLIGAINSRLAIIMHKRIDRKYHQLIALESIEDYLPF